VVSGVRYGNGTSARASSKRETPRTQTRRGAPFQSIQRR
jgi:hypothetical protein